MAGLMDAQAPLSALCTSSNGHLSMYQVSFNSLLYFQRYAPDYVLIAKIKKGRNSENTIAISFMAIYKYILFHFFIFNIFRNIRTSLLLQKLERELTL